MTGLFKFGSRRSPEPAAAAPAARAADDALLASKVLPRLLSALTHQPARVLLDLGPVVGRNISFLGERLACKIFVEDLFEVVEAHARRGDSAGLPAALLARLTQEPGTVDGILCWDLFDFLDRAAGQALASRLTRLVRPGGVVYGFFGTTPVELRRYTRFAVEGEDALRLYPYPATPVHRHVLVARDIIRMFEGLVVAESVLLKSSTREMLFRKP